MRAPSFFFSLCTVLAVATALPLAAQADPGGLARSTPAVEPVPHIAADRTTLAPFSYIRFCHNNPEDCRGGVEATIAWDAEAKIRVWGLNRQVNRQIRPQHDRADVWSAGVAAGDCEDFALTKRQMLVRAGFPASALRMAVARVKGGEGHAVLVVRTSQGDFVLDNRHDRLSEWHQTDLTWLKIASAENPRIWYAMN